MSLIGPFEASILGFFLSGLHSSYDIVKLFSDNSFFWSGSPGSVYAAVRRLEAKEFIRVHSQERAKRYEVTELGQKALYEFCREPASSHACIVDPIVLRVKLRGAVLLELAERSEFYRSQLEQLTGAEHIIRQKQVGLSREHMSYRLSELYLNQLALEKDFIVGLLRELSVEKQ